MWVAWLVRPDTKTRWFLPLEIHDSQLRSSIDLHDLRYLRDLTRPGKRNANSAVVNVDMREIIREIIRPFERRSFSRREFALSSSLHIPVFARHLGSTHRYFRSLQRRTRCCLSPISFVTNDEIPEKLRFRPNVDAGGVSTSHVSQKFAVTSALIRFGAFGITTQTHKRMQRIYDTLKLTSNLSTREVYGRYLRNSLENLKREPSGAVSVITY
ncbi:hypothetical protein ALC62_06482 [Cyphomyrmex costatus]|uniref:Uncharacterized protein n=1 Tax=Cyphomyrmex costatus TaxID=456900 RepID=A0A195CQC9_9HYME|nr:hypothetical protein ALC62_06482 [Cyphomyrmex costatus]